MSSAGTRGLFPPAPEPKTPLARHRILSKSAAVRVSPLCLGAMNFGDAWKDYLGECNKVDSFKMLDTFWEAGGNFIDVSKMVHENLCGRGLLVKTRYRRRSRCSSPLALTRSTEHRLQTTIRIRRAKPGLASGWSKEITEIRSCWLQNIQRILSLAKILNHMS